MAAEEIGLVLTQRLDPTTAAGSNGTINPQSQLVFEPESSHNHHHNSLGFRCGPPPHPPPGVGAPTSKATRELTDFIDERFFQTQGTTEFRRNMYAGAGGRRGIHIWGGNGRDTNSGSGDGDASEDDDEEEEEDEGDGLVVPVENSSSNKNNNSSNTSGQSSEKIENNSKMNHLSSFGSSMEVMKDGNIMPSGNDLNVVRACTSEDHRQGQTSQYQNAVSIADPDGELYYSQYLQGPEGSAAGLKDMVVENGCGFSGRKDFSYSGESGESLRVILSDPLTGALMDDAMILPCGHSFGGSGMQHVLRTAYLMDMSKLTSMDRINPCKKACYTCSQPVSEGSVAPNLSLRDAVLAFRREEELQTHRASKRRRERLEQDGSSFDDSMFMDHPRGRGVQFPFAVADRVIIKGNKRTPMRFVGREAVVTTQCLNGWYVVKTLDNAECVKLQYRSLAKVTDDLVSKQASSSKIAHQIGFRGM